MTGLVFVLAHEFALVAMDTLSVYADDKSPFKYCSKIFLLPHLRGAVCVTGSLELGLGWHAEIQSRIVARDFDYVDDIASAQLQRLSRGIASVGDSTVYHFGYRDSTSALVGSAFRSKNEFHREVLQYGLGIKPPFADVLSFAEGAVSSLATLEGISELFQRLRSSDDSCLRDDRVGIGGQVHLLRMSERQQVVQEVYRWPDYDLYFQKMLANLRRRS